MELSDTIATVKEKIAEALADPAYLYRTRLSIRVPDTEQPDEINAEWVPVGLDPNEEEPDEINAEWVELTALQLARQMFRLDTKGLDGQW
eukprot:COSAG02_NODE_35848_length_462_cov_1.123967_1_plen_89_part_01